MGVKNELGYFIHDYCDHVGIHTLTIGVENEMVYVT